ncbi:hypothetical protein MRX96_017171 [Rhipicephalus microplus]
MKVCFNSVFAPSTFVLFESDILRRKYAGPSTSAAGHLWRFDGLTLASQLQNLTTSIGVSYGTRTLGLMVGCSRCYCRSAFFMLRPLQVLLPDQEASTGTYYCG